MAKKIIVIDDDLYLRELYVEVLQAASYEVDSGSNGEEGLKKLQAGGYDLILLNMIMPRMDGLSVLKSLSQNPPPIKNGPVVILTNLSHDKLIDEVAQFGVKAYLIKAELTPQQVVDYVNTLIAEIEKEQQKASQTTESKT